MTHPTYETAIAATERATYVLANNPGVMTLDGTNTWILREPGHTGVVVVDPGPADEAHLATVMAEATRDGGHVDLVLYTHHHGDHTEAIDRFAELTGAPARAIGEDYCRDAKRLTDTETITVDGLTLAVMATPGHTRDSMSLVLVDEGSLLSGDTILGHGTTVVAYPDGALGPYLDSLAAIRCAIDDGFGGSGPIRRILPAHGAVIEDPSGVVDFYIAHRQDRLDQVRQAVADGAQSPREVVELVYAEVDPALSRIEWALRDGSD